MRSPPPVKGAGPQARCYTRDTDGVNKRRRNDVPCRLPTSGLLAARRIDREHRRDHLGARGVEVDAAVRDERGHEPFEIVLLAGELLGEELWLRAEETGGARNDDNEETLKHRLAVYHDLTEPVLPYYEGKGLLRRIDGMQAIDDVSKQIEAALDKKQAA